MGRPARPRRSWPSSTRALGELRDRLYAKTYTSDVLAGGLTKEWARKLGLRSGHRRSPSAPSTPTSARRLGHRARPLRQDHRHQHLRHLRLARRRSSSPTSPASAASSTARSCRATSASRPASPRSATSSTGSSNVIEPGGPKKGSHAALTRKAAALKPGESGLLALDWNNGNRTILVDQRLTGLLLGQTLHTRPAEIYRALIEATAFGALTIIDRFEEYGVKIRDVVNCGGIAEKNPLVMQIYADVTGLEMKVARSAQTCALGAAIAGAVAAGKRGGGHGTSPRPRRP